MALHPETPGRSRADLRSCLAESGNGAEEIRTPDPMLAKHVLYQLSYRPGPTIQNRPARVGRV